MSEQTRDADGLRRRRTDVVQNAARLLSDATYLTDDGRYATAFALAVLALEEIGKVALDMWERQSPLREPTRRSAHLRKQTAVSSLLLARAAIAAVGDRPIDDDPIDDAIVEDVAKEMWDGRDGRFARLVQIGALDKTKQIAFYRDDWLDDVGLHAKQFTNSDVKEMFDKARSTIAALGDAKSMRVGRVLYERGTLWAAR